MVMWVIQAPEALGGLQLRPPETKAHLELRGKF